MTNNQLTEEQELFKEEHQKVEKAVGGRPTVMTPETLDKLREGFLMGFSDEEAYIYAGVSRNAFYEFQDKHPEFKEQKEEFKKNPILKAKKTIYDRLAQRDLETTKWYLERKKKDEFSARAELTGANGSDLLPKPILGGVANVISTDNSNPQDSGINETN